MAPIMPRASGVSTEDRSSSLPLSGSWRPLTLPSAPHQAREKLLPPHKEDSEWEGWRGLWEMLTSWPPPQLRGPAGAEEWWSQDLRVQKTGVGLLFEEVGFGDTGHPVSPGWLTQPLAYLSDLRLSHSILPYLAARVTCLKLRDDYGTPVLQTFFSFLVWIWPLLTFWIESPSLPTYPISIHPLIHPSNHLSLHPFIHPSIYIS